MKALALLSGGLDSTIATKLIIQQGIQVEAINFHTPFCQCKKGGCGAAEAAKTFNIPLKVINAQTDYLKIVRNPKYGYGKNLNPCIDCRIFMLKKAKKYAKQIGAKFIFTGEVLGQRPMSQHIGALNLIEKEAGLEGKILRPLSAKLLPKTEAQIEGYIKKEALRDIQGRSRKPQLKMVKEFNITNYPCAGGGCLLTDKEFAGKLRDLFAHKKRVTIREVNQLKFGRHFRVGKNKIVVGRNETENTILQRTKLKTDYAFEAVNVNGPITVLSGPKNKNAIRLAAELTAFYSDQKTGKTKIRFGAATFNWEITVETPNRETAESFRVKN